MRRKQFIAAVTCICLLSAAAAPGAVSAEEGVGAEEYGMAAEESADLSEESADSSADEEEFSGEDAELSGQEEDVSEGDSSEEETEESTEAETQSTVLEPPGERPEYDALDYVKPRRYKGMEIEIASVEVTDEQVQAEAENLLSASDVMETVDTVQFGDEVTIDYSGRVNGEDFEGSSSTGYVLEIGSESFLEGFEDGLIGAEVGDVVELDLSYPDDYYLDSLAGSEVLYSVTIQKIQRVPELTDEIVAEVTDGAYTDIESWLDYIRTLLEENMEEVREEEIQEAILSTLASNSRILGYPEGLVEYTVEQAIYYYNELVEMYPPMTYEEFIAAFGYTVESFEATLLEMAEESIEKELLLLAVAESENITLSDADYRRRARAYAASYGYDSLTEFENSYANVYGEGQLEIDLLMDKVMEYLEDNAVITEIDMSQPAGDGKAEEEETEGQQGEVVAELFDVFELIRGDTQDAGPEEDTEAESEENEENADGSGEEESEEEPRYEYE